MLVASTSPGKDAKQTVVQAFLGSTDQVSFQWWPKTVEKAREEALLFVKTWQRASVTEGSLRTDATVRYEILRAPTDQFEIAVPADAKVIAVEGANLKDWDVKTEGGKRTVQARLHAPEKKEYELRLSVERSVDTFPAQLAVPEIEPLHAARETGVIALSKSEYLDVKILERTRLSQIAAEDLPEAAKGKDIFFAGSYVAHPYLLRLDISKIEPKVAVEVLTAVTIKRENAVVQTALKYRIRKAGVFKSRFILPEAVEIREVGDARTVEDHTVETKDGRKTVTVNLSQRAIGDFELPVQCELTRQAETGEFSLPIPEVLDVERQKGTVSVALHETLEAKIASSQNVTPLGLQDILKRVSQPAEEDVRTVFGFQYIKQPATVLLTIEKRKPQVTVRVDSAIQVAEDAVKLKSGLFYTIKYAGITELSFLVPKSLGEELRITGPNIKEKVREEEKVEGEAPRRDRWRVTLQSETLGDYPLHLEYETKLEGIKRGEGSAFDVPEITVADVARENGFFAISKGPNVEVNEQFDGLEEIDTRELSGTSLMAPGTFLAFKYLYHPYKLKLKMTLHEYIGVLQTLVNEAYLESVFSKEGGILTDARYLVQNNQRPLIPLVLPENSKVRALSVGGQPEQPRKGEKGQILIPVAKVEPGVPFIVRMVYETSEDGDEMGLFGALSASAPTLPPEIPVLRLLWDVYVPSDYKYLWTGGNMQAAETRIRGWRSIKEAARLFTPRLAERLAPQQQGQRAGPTLGAYDQGSTGGGAITVNLVREGMKLQFSKLSGDGRVVLPYLNSKLHTAVDVVCLLLTLVAGVSWARKRSKVSVVLGLALGAVILGSFLPAEIADWLDSAFWGAAILALVWFGPGAFQWLRQCRIPFIRRRRTFPAREAQAETDGEAKAADAAEPEKGGQKDE
jgi:hypothetical protein